MSENKPDQLEILCEIPYPVKIGDQGFTVRPLTFNKLVALKPHVQAIFEKVGGVSKLDFNSPKLVNLLFENIEKLAGDLFAAMNVVLTPNGSGKVTNELLKEHLDTVTLGRILGFLVQTSNIGETVKNVSILRGMAKS